MLHHVLYYKKIIKDKVYSVLKVLRSEAGFYMSRQTVAGWKQSRELAGVTVYRPHNASANPWGTLECIWLRVSRAGPKWQGLSTWDDWTSATLKGEHLDKAALCS